MTQPTPDEAPHELQRGARRVARPAEEPSSGAAERELERRARQLARRAAEPTPDGALQLLTFSAAGTTFGVESVGVREVQPVEHLARLPAGARPLVGLVATRGELLPVATLAGLFGTGAQPQGRGWVVVVDDERAPLGLLADDVHGLIEVCAAAVSAPPAGLLTAAADLVRGVTADGVVVLDGPALLERPKLSLATGANGGPP
ncbi:MAG TPA: chemotaxis protein CheW [Nitriliruptorales bacterium]|nr:chemotaxis protein CheW [Nitriliruptorales bacterium]